MSRKDFHDFLLREHSEENYEFYIALKKYEKLCEGIPREFLTDSQNVPHDDPQYPNIERAKEAMSNLITTFFITDGDFELNVPIRVKGPLLEEVQTKRNIHPEVFKDSLFTVLTMLRLSSFPNFQKEALRRSVAKLPDSAPVIPIVQTDPNHDIADSPALESPTKSALSASSRRPISWNPMINIPLKKASNADETKATVQEIWDNEFAPPFSLKDYEKYLSEESDTACIEFYKALKEFKELCKTIPDEQLRNSKLYKEAEVSKAFFSVIQILSKFFAKGAKQDLKIPVDILKPLLAQVNEKRNIHPDVFQASLEYILTQQKQSHFPGFYASASAKGSLRLNKKKSTTKGDDFLSSPIFAKARRISNSASKLEQQEKKDANLVEANTSLKDIQPAETVMKTSETAQSDPTMEFAGGLEGEEEGQAASFAGYPSVPTSPQKLKRVTSLTKAKAISPSKLDQLENEVRQSVVRSSVAGPNGPKGLKARRSSILTDMDNGIKFGVLQVLEDQFSPPFSMKEFVNMFQDHSSEPTLKLWQQWTNLK
ncbi:hypothetical protein HDU99_001300 [Rhizoclosmatium hyalinum]|nr:hypothetical protein HDU99_001300 [Rhizoclosmatium hyalinum]